MKKTLRSVLAGAVALLAVSCYDDSFLRSQNEALKQELNELKESLVDVSEFGINRENALFLSFGAQKSLELTAENIAEYSVMNEPDGWQATIEGTTLNIKAPAKEASEHGAAALTGEITIHATSNKGACKIAKLAVESGEAVRLSVDAEGNVQVLNSRVEEGEDGKPKFASFALGVIDAATWSQIPSMGEEPGMEVIDLWRKYGTMFTQIVPSILDYYSHAEAGSYVEGAYEVDVVRTTAAEVYQAVTMADEMDKQPYVVFLAVLDDMGLPVELYEEIYFNVTFEYTATATYNDIILNVNAEGADSYVVGCVPEMMYKNAVTPTFDAFMNDTMQGPWALFQVYDAKGPIGVEVSEFDGEVSLTELLAGHSTLSLSCLPGLKYHVWVMPMYDFMNRVEIDPDTYDEYVYYDNYDYKVNFLPYVKEVTTSSFSADGPETVIEAGTLGYGSVSAKITLSEGQSAYYGFFTAEDFVAFGEDDAAMKEAIIEVAYENVPIGRPAPIIMETGMVETEVSYGAAALYCVAFTVSADGKAGECESVLLTPKTYAAESTYGVTLKSVTLEGSSYKAVFTVTGDATKLCLYNAASSETVLTNFPKDLCTQSGMNWYFYKRVDVTNGEATVTFSKNATKTHMIVAAYSVTADGATDKVSEVMAIEIESNLPSASN